MSISTTQRPRPVETVQPPSQPPPTSEKPRRRTLLSVVRSALKRRRPRAELDPYLLRQNELERQERERKTLLLASVYGHRW